MPTLRMCSKCGARHAKPTGRLCPWEPVESASTGDKAALSKILQAVTEIKASGASLQTTVEKLTERVAAIEADSSEEDDEGDDDDDDRYELAKERLPNTDNVIPRARALEAAERLCNLQSAAVDDIAPRGKRSVRGLTAKDAGSAIMDWPQFHVYRGANKASPTFDDLTMPEFVVGFLATVDLASQPQRVKDLQLKHLSKLMIDAQTWEWTTVRHLHGIARQEIELARLSWGDAAGMQELRLTYLIQAPVQAPARRLQTTAPAKPRLPACKPYQNGQCTLASPHSSDSGTVRHVCAYCVAAVGYGCYHAESECQRKTAKNGTPELRK
jgi:hypothetical protein